MGLKKSYGTEPATGGRGTFCYEVLCRFRCSLRDDVPALVEGPALSTSVVGTDFNSLQKITNLIKFVI